MKGNTLRFYIILKIQTLRSFVITSGNFRNFEVRNLRQSLGHRIYKKHLRTALVA